MSSTNKGKTDPQLRLEARDAGLIFPVQAEPADGTPTIISKGRPTIEPKPTDAAEQVIDLAMHGNGESATNNVRGKRLSHFELIEPIGVGGMAAVLRARDTQLDRQVALKILPPEMAADPENVRRFHQEAKAAARLDHENIARVFFCGEDQGLHFIAFEYVEGDNLRTLLERRGRLPVGEAVHYVLQVATGLEHAASRGVVHRDVKPSNIIISSNGRAKLVDMGLARNMERHGEADLTQSGVTLGTFDYISPEQALEPRDADARSDIYSLGCTFYHMLTGQPPVPEGTAAKKLHHHQHVAPVDPRQFNPDIPDEIAVIVSRMMHKDARARYQRPIQLVQHLMQVAQKVGAADGVPEGVLFVDAPLPAGPHQQTLLIVAVPFLALALLIGFLALYPNEPPVPTTSRAATVVPAAPIENTTSGTTPIRVVPPSVAVSLPGEDKGVSDAKVLEAILKDPSFKQRQTIPLEGVISLAAVKGLTLRADANQKVTLTSKDPKAAARFQFDVDEENPIGLTIQGGTAVFEGITFELASARNWDQVTALIAVSGATHVEFRKCVFEQRVPQTNPERAVISSVLVKAADHGAPGTPDLLFDKCIFGSDTGQAKPGQDAVALAGPARLRAVDCGFRPHAAFFHFRAGCEPRITSVQCDHCSGFVVNGPVFRFDLDTAAKLRVAHCMFSRTEPTAAEPGPADLIHQRNETSLAYQGEGNYFDRLNDLWSGGTSHKNTREEFNDGLAALKNGSREVDSEFMLRDDSPSPWYGRPDQSSPLAFQLKPEYVQYGLQHGPWGKLVQLVAKEELGPNEKLFDPDYRGPPGSIFKSFERALAFLERGDTLLIRPGKDGRPIELPPTALRANIDATLKAYPGTAPVLTLGKATEKKDLAFFRLLDGSIKLEGLHLVLGPRLDGPGPQSVLLLGDNAQATLERCVITLRGPRRAAAIALVNPNELMQRPDQPRFMKSRVDLKNCFVRGEGDLVALSSCRPLVVSVDNSLVALSGSLLAVQGTPQEVPPDQGPQLHLTHVSAFAQKPLFSLICAAKNGKGLAQTTIEATACLFAPINEKPALIYLEAKEADVVTDEQLGKYLQWTGKDNSFAKFDPMLALERPNEMGNGMPLDPQRWGKLFGEPRAGKSDFTVPLSADTPLAQATPDLLRPLETEGLLGGCGPLTELQPLLKRCPLGSANSNKQSTQARRRVCDPAGSCGAPLPRRLADLPAGLVDATNPRAGGLMPLKLSAFPKCYIDQIAGTRTMSVFDWIEMARALDADGLEMFDAFFDSLEPAYLDRVGNALQDAGFAMPMLCCSPDFSNPDADARQRAVEREAELVRATRRLGGPRAVCRVLSGQRYPEVPRQQGLQWVAECIEQVLPVAREYDIILGLENHYKDSFWKYPEFAQKMDVFLELLAAIPDRSHFGVQYDPSNAIVAGDDPVELLRRVADRVVSMHASDRYLADGATLDELRQTDGTLGYSPNLRHGVTGKGLNDYDAIFRILAEAGYQGWVSIEDGMNGLDEMAESLAFLRRMSAKYFPA